MARNKAAKVKPSSARKKKKAARASTSAQRPEGEEASESENDSGEGLTTTKRPWAPPATTKTIAARKLDIEQAMAGSRVRAAKMGDEYRMTRSVWDCDARVFAHEDAGPLRHGMPVGTFRPDDQGVPEGSDRLIHRRIVLLNFSAHTGNKVWSLMNLNVYGRTPTPGNGQTIDAKQAVLANIKNVDYFQEFDIMEWKPASSGYVLKAKKQVVFSEMNRQWKMGWAMNWNHFFDLIENPQKSQERSSRIERLLDGDYDIPFFDETLMDQNHLQEQKEELSRRIDHAMLTGIQTLARLREREEKEGLTS
ncbi:uncharacterized protein N7506_006895 [Penicillium brevicompactum]|uniref:uncharacterized protein n=1 Tax=Penicillium brevicompactum TaxID=5074 RepID=UPI002540662C|nr:uncharacterized protein N7506_006895 [Penicillium brevicompactum]KAJ5333112.1 hypothetical protein N7506_006895 [Penicillium brevicompactum]